MSFLDLFRPKQESHAASANPTSPPAAQQQAPSPQHGIAANHLLNKAAVTGHDGAQRDLGKLQAGAQAPGAVVKDALGDLFSGFTDNAKHIAGAFKSAGTSLHNALFSGTDPGPAYAAAAAQAGPTQGAAAAQAAGPTQGAAAAQAAGLTQGAAAAQAGPTQRAAAATEPEENTQDQSKIQQYSQSGVPLTKEAWSMQDSIDGGKLHQMYKDVQSDLNAKDNALQLKPGQTADSVVIQRYIDAANNNAASASFMLEVMPTEMHFATQSPNAGGTGTGVGDFRVGGDVAQTRQVAKSVADTLVAQDGKDPNALGEDAQKKARENIYSLMVPYNNGGENIAAHDGVPQDGVNSLHNYLGKIDKRVKTVATGYSQGGAAVLEYAHQFGGTDGLDKVVALAPMGGADRYGADGVFSGKVKKEQSFLDRINPFKSKEEDQGVDVLSIMNASDPAKHIYDPLRDQPGMRSARDFAVTQAVPSVISNGIRGMGALGGLIPGLGPVINGGANLAAGAWDGALSLLKNPQVQDKLAQVAERKLEGSNPELAHAIPGVVDMLQDDHTKLADVLAIAPSMVNFTMKGGLNNMIKDGLGWAGAKTTQIGSMVGTGTSLLNPLLGTAVTTGSSFLGSTLTNKSSEMAREDGDLHGAPEDKNFSLGTYGYPMEAALPLLGTFLGDGNVIHGGSQKPEILALQQQIATNQNNAYGRRGDWTQKRTKNDTDDDPNTPVKPTVIGPA